MKTIIIMAIFTALYISYAIVKKIKFQYVINVIMYGKKRAQMLKKIYLISSCDNITSLKRIEWRTQVSMFKKNGKVFLNTENKIIELRLNYIHSINK